MLISRLRGERAPEPTVISSMDPSINKALRSPFGSGTLQKVWFLRCPALLVLLKLALLHFVFFLGELSPRCSALMISEELEKTGYKVVEQPYVVDKKEVRNLEIVIPGKTKECVVIGAHFDTFGPTKGANDNATGVAGLIEVANYLSKRN